RESGMFRKTDVRLTYRVEFRNPVVLDYFKGWLESVSYHFQEQGDRRAVTSSIEFELPFTYSASMGINESGANLRPGRGMTGVFGKSLTHPSGTGKRHI